MVLSGEADLVLGGPGGVEVSVSAGGALILPARTGHCLQLAGRGFSVVGVYSDGRGVETLTARDGIPEGPEAGIVAVPPPCTDPFDGVLARAWNL